MQESSNHVLKKKYDNKKSHVPKSRQHCSIVYRMCLKLALSLETTEVEYTVLRKASELTDEVPILNVTFLTVWGKPKIKKGHLGTRGTPCQLYF